MTISYKRLEKIENFYDFLSRYYLKMCKSEKKSYDFAFHLQGEQNIDIDSSKVENEKYITIYVCKIIR